MRGQVKRALQAVRAVADGAEEALPCGARRWRGGGAEATGAEVDEGLLLLATVEEELIKIEADPNPKPKPAAKAESDDDEFDFGGGASDSDDDSEARRAQA